jgi:hypothetical protein
MSNETPQLFSQPQVDVGFSLAKYLNLLPGGTRFAALIIIAFLGMAAYLVYSASGLERVFVIVMVFGLIGLLIASAHVLQRGEKRVAGVYDRELRNKLILDAPPQETQDGQSRKLDYDLFIATAMDAFPDPAERAAAQRQTKEIIEALRTSCGFKDIFYAAFKATDSNTDDPPNIALKLNVLRMRASKRFLLIYYKHLPTSALMEAGMALGLNKPSVWFLAKDVEIPFLMRGASAAAQIENFPPITTYSFNNHSQILNYIKSNGISLFDDGTQATALNVNINSE